MKRQKRMTAAGGWPAIWYTVRQARQAGGVFRMLTALRSRNACKTCALGMGGQHGGMVNETGHFPEVCKKSVQAMAADMQGRLKPDFFETVGFDKLERMTPRELEASGRIVAPLYAGPDDASYRPITWEEAIKTVADELRAAAPDETFFYFSGRSSNEAGFLLQLFARVYGTNNVNNCSFFCHQASGVGLSSVTGSGTATVTLEDVGDCDLLFLIGGNPASNHPRLMRTLIDLKRRGGTIIVINPLRELGLTRFRVPSDVRSLLFGSDIADEYLQPHIGGDIALLTGLVKSLTEAGQLARPFIDAHTEGWAEFERSVTETAWEQIEHASGVTHQQIARIADQYAASSKSIFCWTMGITHHAHGVDNVRMIANAAIARGMLGKPGAGLLPLRGHSNVQGIGSMGVTPALKDATFRALEERYGLTLPTTPGLDTLSCLYAAGNGTMRVAFALGGNLFGSAPDATNAHHALRRVGLSVFMSTTLNTGHALGRGQRSLILPVLARDEEHERTTQESMFNYVRVSNGGPKRHDGPRSEVGVIASIARAVLGDNSPVDFHALEQHASIRDVIANVIPGYEAIAGVDNQDGDRGGEFEVAGRTFHKPSFATPNGRAIVHSVPIPMNTREPDTLRLMTIRSEGQFNTVVYEEEDIYRGQERRDIIMMNPEDLRSMGLKIDQRVCVESEAGKMDGLLVRAIEIRAGNAAMYCPEANRLVPATADPNSRTPAFKNVPIRVRASSRLPVVGSV